MGQTLGNTFGKSDSSATNDVLGGKVVATGTPGASTMRDPNRGLDDSQVRNRKLAAAGGKALGGFLDPSQSPANGGSGGTTFTFADRQPNYRPLSPSPKPPPPISDPYNYTAPRTRNPFFG